MKIIIDGSEVNQSLNHSQYTSIIEAANKMKNEIPCEVVLKNFRVDMGSKEIFIPADVSITSK